MYQGMTENSGWCDALPDFFDTPSNAHRKRKPKNKNLVVTVVGDAARELRHTYDG